MTTKLSDTELLAQLAEQHPGHVKQLFDIGAKVRSWDTLCEDENNHQQLGNKLESEMERLLDTCMQSLLEEVLEAGEISAGDNAPLLQLIALWLIQRRLVRPAPLTPEEFRKFDMVSGAARARGDAEEKKTL